MQIIYQQLNLFCPWYTEHACSILILQLVCMAIILWDLLCVLYNVKVLLRLIISALSWNSGSCLLASVPDFPSNHFILDLKGGPNFARSDRGSKATHKTIACEGGRACYFTGVFSMVNAVSGKG